MTSRLSGFTLAGLCAVLALCGWTGDGGAAEIRTAIGMSLPPYIIQAEKRGLEYDIAKEALALEGHVLVPVFLPFARVTRAMQGQEVDAALTLNENSGVEAAYSDSHITYRNYAITLTSRHLRIDSVADLKGKSIVAFQNASNYLGDGYRAAVEGNSHYREEARQELQNTLLFSGRTDVIVGDGTIFAWYNKAVADRVDATQPVTMHAIFEPTVYKMAFRDPAVRDSFNRGLAQLRASGEYDRIVARYSR